MQVQVTTLTVRKNGSLSKRPATVTAEVLRFGRGTDNEVLLSDVRVGLAEAELHASEAGLFVNQVGPNSLRINGGYQRTTVDGRQGLWATLTNVNEATGRPENIRVITTQLRNGQLFYMIAVAPQSERNFESAFQNVLRSLRLND